VQWEVSHVRDALVAPPVGLTGLIDAARNRLLDEGWLTVCASEAAPTSGSAHVSEKQQNRLGRGVVRQDL
jgi:hypothetical protein